MHTSVRGATLTELAQLDLSNVFQHGGSLPKKTITVKSTDKISKAFTLIFKHNITSLPVRQVDSGTFCSFVEIVDLLLFVIQLVHRGTEPKVPRAEITMLLSDPSFKKRRCSELANMSGHSSFIPIDSTVSLQAAIEEIILSNLQRLVVLNSKQELMGILSHSRIVNFLAPSLLQQEWIDLELKQIPSLFSSIQTIKQDQTVLEAFKEIYKKGLRALPVTNHSNQLIGFISSSDIKNLGGDTGTSIFDVLDFPLSRFIQEVIRKKHKKNKSKV